MTGQPKLFSFYEAIFNVSVGFVIGLISNEIVLPLFGYNVNFWDSFNIAIIFTVISIMRSYLIRRFFNWIHIRKV